MLLPRNLVDVFTHCVVQFYGVKSHAVFDCPKRGVYAKIVLGDCLLVVREHADNIQTYSETLEVWSNNSEKLKEIERVFTAFLRELEKKTNEESNN